MKLGSNFKLCWKKRNMIRKYSFSSARWQKKQGIMIPSSSSHLSGWPTISRFLSLKISRPTKFIQFRNVVRPFFEAQELWNVRSGCCLRPAVHADGSRQNGLVAGLFGKIEKKNRTRFKVELAEKEKKSSLFIYWRFLLSPPPPSSPTS